MTPNKAIAVAKNYDWQEDDAEDAMLVLSRSGMTSEDAAASVVLLAKRFPGPVKWHVQIRAFVEGLGAVHQRVERALGFDAALSAAVEQLASRRLGIRFVDGIDELRPLRGLVAVLDLSAETLAAISPLAAAGHVSSPGWFIARVLYLPDGGVPGLEVGDKVLVEERCQPDGAGWIPSEEFGLAPGGRVILVPCRRLPSPTRSEEVVERMRDVAAIKARYPVAEYPTTHRFWRTPEGEATLAQLGEHSYQMRQIMAARRGCSRNRLIKPGREDTTLPEGILAVIE